MSFTESVRSVFGKYATFSGRAGRAEYWWFQLFLILVGVGFVFGFIFLVGATRNFGLGFVFLIGGVIFALATLIPSLAVSVRRLHDTGRSGWWYLIGLVPYIGGLILLILVVLPGTPGQNRYGPQPGAPDQHIASYGGTTRDEALARFAADRQQAAAYGYYPMWQTWRQQPGVEILDVMYGRGSGAPMVWGSPPPPPSWG